MGLEQKRYKIFVVFRSLRLTRPVKLEENIILYPFQKFGYETIQSYIEKLILFLELPKFNPENWKKLWEDTNSKDFEVYDSSVLLIKNIQANSKKEAWDKSFEKLEFIKFILSLSRSCKLKYSIVIVVDENKPTKYTLQIYEERPQIFSPVENENDLSFIYKNLKEREVARFYYDTYYNLLMQDNKIWIVSGWALLENLAEYNSFSGNSKNKIRKLLNKYEYFDKTKYKDNIDDIYKIRNNLVHGEKLDLNIISNRLSLEKIGGQVSNMVLYSLNNSFGINVVFFKKEEIGS
ncbi:MAG: hypothetical protein ABIJ18_01345 [archaeon]